MPKVFISSCDIDSTHPSALLNKLREAGFDVLHSPRRNQEVHWGNWYDRDFQSALVQTDIFVTAITEYWPGSTWMQHEAWEAQKRLRAGKMRRMFFYNPENIKVTEEGMLHFLNERLPDDLEEAALILKGA